MSAPRKIYPVESGVSKPKSAERTYYPWKTTAVGESFHIPRSVDVAIRSCRQNVYAANRRFKEKNLPHRFEAWREFSADSKEFIGMRVQRIA